MIESIIKGKRATVGVAVRFDDGEMLVVNNELHYPTMSVYKFHLALAVLDELNKKMRPLDTEIFIRESDLLPDTHSPLRDSCPTGGFNMSIRNLLRYSVAQSDNNACDILFRYVGGTKVVSQYIASLGISDVAIALTEEEMKSGFDSLYKNWTTPSAAVEVMEVFLKKDLFAPVYKDFLIHTLFETSTGPNKLRGLLPSDVKVGHKTGNSPRNEADLKAADNDLGFVRLPDGREYSIAVFVMDSYEDDDTNAAIIAEISKAVYDYSICQKR